MSEQLYSIKESTLTDIGDALRRRHGETRMETILVDVFVPNCVVSKTPNATGFDTWDGYTPSSGFLDVVRMSGATSIKVKMAYKTATTGASYTSIFIASGEYNSANFPINDANRYYDSTANVTTPSNVEVLFENTDTITFCYRTASSYDVLGYYAECIPLDADGNALSGQTVQKEIEAEVKNTYSSDKMAQAIDDIEVGEFLPEEAFVVTGLCNYRFAYNGWNWFISAFGDSITTENITSAANMFANSDKLKKIPFVLNISPTQHDLNNAFYGAGLEEVPKLNIPVATRLNSTSLFSGCNYLRDFNGVFVDEEAFGASWQSFINTTSFGGHYANSMLQQCYSLRTVPSWLYCFKLNPDSTAYPYYGYSLYYNTFNLCYALDEVLNFPVWKCKGSVNQNMFSGTFGGCSRAKNITFETQEDGSPIVVEWKNQVIELQSNVGYVANVATLFNYNSGITRDKQVSDDTSYQSLKDDPDWFTSLYSYSRYNHDSAVNTINSLPDTSAFGTNTIKFTGKAGEKTDGGAINTLTEEEIAVAAAKGWTVTLV